MHKDEKKGSGAFFVRIFLSSFFVLSLFFSSCSKKVQSVSAHEIDRVVIWTNCSEFAQYAELFNKTHSDVHAVIVYKDNPAESLPPAKDEFPPDIIAGPFLRTDENQKYLKILIIFLTDVCFLLQLFIRRCSILENLIVIFFCCQ